MPKQQFDNRILIGIFAVLAIIYFGTDYARTQKRSGNKSLPTLAIFSNDEVDKIRLTAPDSEAPIEVMRTGANEWEVTQSDKRYTADPQMVERYFRDLKALKTTRLISRKAERKSDYSVNDSLGTRVQVFAGDETLSDFYVGRFKYSPSAGGFGGITYVREAEVDDIYAVEGFQNPNINKPLADWRIQRVLQFERDEVEDLVWTYPADSGFVLNQTTNGWKVDAAAADSVKAINFIIGLSSLRDRNFYEGEVPQTEPDFRLKLSLRKSGMQEVQAWKHPNEEDSFLSRSTMNQEAYFTSKKNGLFQKLFPKKDRFF